MRGIGGGVDLREVMQAREQAPKLPPLRVYQVKLEELDSYGEIRNERELTVLAHSCMPSQFFLAFTTAIMEDGHLVPLVTRIIGIAGLRYDVTDAGEVPEPQGATS